MPRENDDACAVSCLRSQRSDRETGPSRDEPVPACASITRMRPTRPDACKTVTQKITEWLNDLRNQSMFDVLLRFALRVRCRRAAGADAAPRALAAATQAPYPRRDLPRPRRD